MDASKKDQLIAEFIMCYYEINYGFQCSCNQSDKNLKLFFGSN